MAFGAGAVGRPPASYLLGWRAASHAAAMSAGIAARIWACMDPMPAQLIGIDPVCIEPMCIDDMGGDVFRSCMSPAAVDPRPTAATIPAVRAAATP